MAEPSLFVPLVSQIDTLANNICDIQAALAYPLAMWMRHLWNLVAKGWQLMVTKTGTSTLGFVVWICALAAVCWMATVLQKFAELRARHDPHPFSNGLRQSLMGGLYSFSAIGILTIAVWGLFCAVAVYRDHMQLTAENASLRRQLEYHATHGLSLRIAGLISSEVNHDSTRIQLTVIANNDGEPTTAREWKLAIHTSTGDLSSYHAFGDQLAKDSLELPRLDARLQSPIYRGTEIPGLISFIFPKIAQSRIDHLRTDPTATLVLSAFDENGKSITAERNIGEMAKERFERRPSK